MTDWVALLTVGLLGAALALAVVALGIVWRDRRPQHRADASENEAIRHYVDHASVWVRS